MGKGVKLFEQKKIRTHWDDAQEKWYFSVADVVEVLTESVNPADYIKKIKKRDPLLAERWGQFVPPLSIQTEGGKQRVNCADTEGILRLVQSIPSKKAPFLSSIKEIKKGLFSFISLIFNDVCAAEGTRPTPPGSTRS